MLYNLMVSVLLSLAKVEAQDVSSPILFVFTSVGLTNTVIYSCPGLYTHFFFFFFFEESAASIGCKNKKKKQKTLFLR